MKRVICIALSLLCFLGGIAWSIGLTIANKDKVDALKAYNDTLVETTCTITARSNIEHRHRTYDYIYSVDGKQYTGQASKRVKKSDGGAVLYNIHHVGDVLPVWYDPADPSVSYMVKLNITGSYWLPSLFGLILAFGCFAVTAKWAFSD